MTTFYQLIPAELTSEAEPLSKSRYLKPGEPAQAALSDELLTISLRYKHPDRETTEELCFPISTAEHDKETSSEFKFAAAVTCFGMLLQGSAYKGDSTFDLVLDLAEKGMGHAPNGYREEFIKLVRKADSLMRQTLHEKED